MSGLRRLSREAGRAAAFMRRLYRTLDPVRRASSRPADWGLVSADERLAPLTDAADPLASLTPVLARLGTRSSTEEPHPRMARHRDVAAQPFGSAATTAGRGFGPGESAQRRPAPAGIGAAAGHPVDPVLPPGARRMISAGTLIPDASGHPIAHPAHAPVSGPAMPFGSRTMPPAPSKASASGTGEPRVSRRPQGMPPASASEPVLHSPHARDHQSMHGSEPAPLHRVSQRAAAATASTPATAHTAASVPARPRDPNAHWTPSRAADVFAERMRAANTLDAFRTAISISGSGVPARVAKSTPPDGTSVRTSPFDAGATQAASRSPLTAALEDRVAAASAARAQDSRRTLSGPTHLPALDVETTPETKDLHDPSPRAAAVRRDDLLESRPGTAGLRAGIADLGASGLRRLAALATGSLDEPAAPVAPVTPTPPLARLEEELDRILRTEALSYGIDAEGLGR